MKQKPQLTKKKKQQKILLFSGVSFCLTHSQTKDTFYLVTNDGENVSGDWTSKKPVF